MASKKVMFSPSPEFLRLAKLAAADFEIGSLHSGFARELANLDLKVADLAATVTSGTQRLAARSAVAALTRFAQSIGQAADGLRPDIYSVAQEELPGLVYARLGELALMVAALDAYRPDLLVLHNDVEPNLMAAAAWAREHGIPAIHVPHAVYMDHAERARVGYDIHDVVTATHLAAAGPFQAAWYAARGMDKESIRLTGLPQFDRWARPISQEEARRILKLRLNQPVVVYASSWAQATSLAGIHGGVEKTYQAFLEAAQHFPPEIQVVVKVHPSGRNLPFHLEEARKAGLRCLVTAAHLDVVLPAADLLLSYGPSNIILEGAFLPWVRLAVTHDMKEPGVTVVGTDAQNIFDGVRELLSRPPADATALLDKYCYPRDGQAAMRIVQWMRELA